MYLSGVCFSNGSSLFEFDIRTRSHNGDLLRYLFAHPINLFLYATVLLVKYFRISNIFSSIC